MNENKAKLNPNEILGELEKDIARRLKHYEKRQAQLDLMRLVIEGFNEDLIIAAEAGTGVGKSFAYLLPAIKFGLLSNERVVISTATITLQQQLFEKDIPLVLSAMPPELLSEKKFKAALLKGRKNYLCLRRLGEAACEVIFDDEKESLKAIAKWAMQCNKGELSELSVAPDPKVWARVCSESDNCLGNGCEYKESCFALKARREASESQLVVVNHHLLFADLAARHDEKDYESTFVLPPYTRVIIDESHTMEPAATSFFSEKFSATIIHKQLGQLLQRHRANLFGLLTNIGLKNAHLDRLEKDEQDIKDACDNLDSAGTILCGNESSFRFIIEEKGKHNFEKILNPFLKALKAALERFLSDMKIAIEERIKKKDEESVTLFEIRVMKGRVESFIDMCEAFMFFDEYPGSIFWIEKQRDWIQWIITPVDAARVLKSHVFDPLKTLICVSATLTVAGGWDYWLSSCGLSRENERLLTGIFPSPFPYSQKVLLAVPLDAPLPTDPAYREFVDGLVPKLVAAGGGSSLVLFTSYESLKSSFEAAQPILEALGLRCMKQGDKDRMRLLRDFLDDEKSVLFATDSFWEGVDAPGDTLRMVVLCRLPFRTPGDPVFQARCEALEKQGGNSFMELSVPEAVMKFKQGFGRLMRSSSDHGVVAVLDGRLIHKRYGRHFLNSLPVTLHCFSDSAKVVQSAGTFLSTSQAQVPLVKSA